MKSFFSCRRYLRSFGFSSEEKIATWRYLSLRLRWMGGCRLSNSKFMKSDRITEGKITVPIYIYEKHLPFPSHTSAHILATVTAA